MCPWMPDDAETKTRTAITPKAKKQWAAVANSELKRTGDDGLAVKAANGVIKKRFGGIGDTRLGTRGKPRRAPRKVIQPKG